METLPRTVHSMARMRDGLAISFTDGKCPFYSATLGQRLMEIM